MDLISECLLNCLPSRHEACLGTARNIAVNRLSKFVSAGRIFFVVKAGDEASLWRIVEGGEERQVDGVHLLRLAHRVLFATRLAHQGTASLIRGVGRLKIHLYNIYKTRGK